MTLTVENLSVDFGTIPVVKDVSFNLKPGTTTALIGESGSGKSLTALAIMGLLPDDIYISGGRVLLDGKDLVKLPEKSLVGVRGARIAMVFQDSLSALNPVHTIGRQLSESFRIHGGPTGSGARTRAIELLELVQIPDPAKRLKSYPHQLSGGQRQRVAIAMALAGEPEVLIADEPTTALDVRVQASIVALLASIVRETNTSLMFITHDLPIAAELCDEVLVMYGGKVVERGATRSVLTKPYHPYTQGLVSATPSDKWDDANTSRLPTIAGNVPPLGKFPSGCPFRDRCFRADEQCLQMPPLESASLDLGAERQVACWHDLSGEDRP